MPNGKTFSNAEKECAEEYRKTHSNKPSKKVGENKEW
jgi:hypothetical protein